MHKSTSLADTETVIEFVSSHAVRALKEKKQKFRRRLVVAVLTGLKILTVVYFGFGELFEAGNADASTPHFEVVAPLIP